MTNYRMTSLVIRASSFLSMSFLAVGLEDSTDPKAFAERVTVNLLA